MLTADQTQMYLAKHPTLQEVFRNINIIVVKVACGEYEIESEEWLHEINSIVLTHLCGKEN